MECSRNGEKGNAWHFRTFYEVVCYLQTHRRFGKLCPIQRYLKRYYRWRCNSDIHQNEISGHDHSPVSRWNTRSGTVVIVFINFLSCVSLMVLLQTTDLLHWDRYAVRYTTRKYRFSLSSVIVDDRKAHLFWRKYAFVSLPIWCD